MILEDYRVANGDGPVMPITAFYNAMVSTGVTVSLYSGKDEPHQTYFILLN
jgi:hypothetical protein